MTKNTIQKVFRHYKTIPLGSNGQIVLTFFDAAAGSAGTLAADCNWPQNGNSLPDGILFILKKIGFDIRKADGSAIAPATLGAIANGFFMFQKSQREVREGSLREFISNPVTGQTLFKPGPVFNEIDIAEQIQPKETISFTLTLNLAAATTEAVIISPLLKGLETISYN
jgi:hypothetical protein